MEDFLHTHYGLMHFINSTSPTVNLPIKLIQVLQQEVAVDSMKIIPYSEVPRTAKQQHLDERLTPALAAIIKYQTSQLTASVIYPDCQLTGDLKTAIIPHYRHWGP